MSDAPRRDPDRRRQVVSKEELQRAADDLGRRRQEIGRREAPVADDAPRAEDERPASRMLSIVAGRCAGRDVRWRHCGQIGPSHAP